MHMACVLFYELCEANVIGAQFTDAVEDTGLTGVKEGQVLGHLCFACKNNHYVSNIQSLL